MNARDMGFRAGMIKAAASPWAGALPDPNKKRLLFTALGGAALGVAGASGLMLALSKRKNARKRS